MPGWLSRHHPGDPGFRRKIAASRYLRLIPSGLSGTGGGNIPVKPALSAHPCASPRPTGNASAIYSRTEASLKALSYSEATLSLLLSNYWGSLSPRGEATNIKNGFAFIPARATPRRALRWNLRGRLCGSAFRTRRQIPTVSPALAPWRTAGRRCSCRRPVQSRRDQEY